MALNSGADVAINSMALENPSFWRSSFKFCSSTITVNVEAKKILKIDGSPTNSVEEKTNLNKYDWINEIQNMGAGEILLTSIDN